MTGGSLLKCLFFFKLSSNTDDFLCAPQLRDLGGAVFVLVREITSNLENLCGKGDTKQSVLKKDTF